MASKMASKKWLTELYSEQKKAHWPSQGRHILAQFDEDSIVVYQAYNPTIADYAVQHQRFGGDAFSFSRMSWIKTNFLWMMYRCGWCTKKNQERVLAVRLTREGFDTILKTAFTPKKQKDAGLGKGNIEVRLQWDPDHTPTYEKLERKAIQLGLKDKTLKTYSDDWIISIEDITPFVIEQRENTNAENIDKLVTAMERVYPVSQEIQDQIGNDPYPDS